MKDNPVYRAHKSGVDPDPPGGCTITPSLSSRMATPDVVRVSCNEAVPTPSCGFSLISLALNSGPGDMRVVWFSEEGALKLVDAVLNGLSWQRDRRVK